MDVENALNDGKPVGDELCRLCANTDKQFIPIFQEEGMEHNISEQIKKYLPIIRVTKVDKLPLQVCYQCTSTLLSWHNFFEQCRVADNRLREILSVNVEFNKDDESCHDYADDFRDDFDDQPSLSDRICDIPEKSVHFDLTVNEAMDSSDSVNKDSKSVTENADDSRCLRMTHESTDKKCAFAQMLGLKRKRRCSSRHSKSTAPSVDDAVAPTDNERVNEPASGICACVWSDANDCAACTSRDKFECACCPTQFAELRLRNRHVRSQHRDRLFDYCFDWLYENGRKSSTAAAEETEEKSTFGRHDCADSFPDGATSTNRPRTRDKTQPTVRKAKAFVCEHCAASSATKSALIAHLRSAHAHIFGAAARGAEAAAPDADYYTCDVCGHAFLKLAALTRHLNSHSAGQFACSKCERCFASQTELDGHDLQRHKGLAKNVFVVDGRKYLKCDQCPFTCRNERTKLEDHLRVHTGEKPFTCETCGKQFRTRTLLGVHQRYVHDGVKKFACDLCGRRFSSRRYMQDHRRIHTGERPLICHLCGNAFRQSSSLMKHLDHHAGVKRHACHLCDKRFTNAHRLKVHIKRHLGVTTHACAECGKGFVDRYQLKDHQAVHSDARPHVCQQCGATFKLRKHLRQHWRTHKFARKMTGGRGPKDDVCPAPKTAAARDAGDECAGTRSGSAASSCECPKAADRAECRTCAERRGRGARCQRCPMVFLSADRLADHMSSSHDQRRPQSSSTRESANTTSADSRRKRRASESGAPASESKRREVETRPAAPAQNCATTVSSFRCARCPKTYRLASSLKRHSAVHRRLAVFEGDDKSDENGGRNGESTLETDTSDVDRPTQKADSIGNPAEATDSSKSAPTEQPKKGSKATTKKRRLSKAPVAPADQQPALRVDTIVCSVCRQTFDDESAFTEHQRLQHGGAHPAGCDVCQLEWPTATLLRAHKIANHLERQRCRAGADDDPFSRWYVHVDGQKHLKCDQCAYNSLWHNKGRFLEHYRIHTGERPFTCDLCGKQFRTRSLMHKHVTYVHEGVKEHPCDLCGRRFSDKRYMEDHRRIHTGERPYVCDLCGKTFKQGASLFIHKELHKGLRKHACDMCGKRFTTSSSLSVHIKRHVGERNFVCATCGKAFVDGKHLRDHLTVHSDDRPFGCELCGARFKLMKHLKQHGRTHKRDFPS